MSHSTKLSLWQKIKQLLKPSAAETFIDDIKITEDLDALTDGCNTSHPLQDELNNTDIHPRSNSNVDSNDANSNHIDADTNTESTTEQGIDELTPIVDYLKQYFDSKEWYYTHYQLKTSDSQQSHHLSLRMRNKQLDCGYLFRVQEENKLLAVYGILPFLIPESHQSAAMLLITQINYDMLIGNLEMDINEGEIRYKNAIDIEAVGIDDNIIEHLLQSVIAMTTFAYALFSDLVNNQDPVEDLQDLLSELQQQVDSRTFFLPTQFVQ